MSDRNLNYILLTPSVKEKCGDKEIVINVANNKYESKWQYYDNSALLLLSFLDGFDIKSVSIAGFDGFRGDDLYAAGTLKANVSSKNEKEKMQTEVEEMIEEFANRTNLKISFITDSPFSKYFLSETFS